MLLYLVLGLILGTVLAGAAIYFLTKKQSNSPDQLSEDIFNKLNQRFPEILNQANQLLISSAKQSLSAEKQEISSDLSNKKQAIETLVAEIRKQLEDNNKKIETAEQGRIGSFEGLKTALAQQAQLTQQLSVTAEGLKKVLSNNQLRGQFGEQIADDLLKMAGFVAGTDYEKQLGGATSRPDFTVFMPDGTKINVDSKFPYSNLLKMSETEDLAQKDQYLRAFEQDIKAKLKEVSTRDYINPTDNTVDFVILFIPNEMIFSFIYERFPQILQEALVKKVVLAGPFSFTALLRLIRQSYQTFRIQKDVKNIISQIQQFQLEFTKYNEEFLKIGDKIDGLQKQYQSVETTRRNKLEKVMDKIQLDSPQPSPSLLPPLDTT